MKLSLVVLTPGKWEGKTIPVTRSPFVIGRDPQCHLRPGSAIVSKRHCALAVQKDKVFVRDFDSTNGTFLNNREIKGEIEVLDGDQLKIGSLVFAVRVEGPVPVNSPTPMPPTKGLRSVQTDEAAAAVLLAHMEEGGSAPGAKVDSEGVPTGSTVMEVRLNQSPAEAPNPAANEKAERVSPGDTAMAAKAILDKYVRRPHK
jgi:pSer/pThr/pTyr-binding forkhead associated (FHA) protein